MRRNYITEEFNKSSVYGTFNMVEEGNFFGSKMLNIDDEIVIDNQSIIYYQKDTNEQIDIGSENILKPIIYNASDNKKGNHLLKYDDKQSETQLNDKTKWEITINLKKILTNHIFAEFKKWRTFEGILNNMTIYNNVDTAINNYIDFNVLNRYKLSNIILYVKYNDLKTENILKFDNKWDNTINTSENLVNQIQLTKYPNDEIVKISFNQDKSSSLYSYVYYFDIIFEKI